MMTFFKFWEGGDPSTPYKTLLSSGDIIMIRKEFLVG